MTPLEAIGRAVAVAVTADADLPARTMAARDGWAVEGDTVTGAGPYSPVYLPAEPAWVDAGAPLPPGTDTILPPEALLLDGGPEVIADVAPGAGTMRRGSELRRGDRLVEAGRHLTAAQAGILALAGVGTVKVRTPAISLVTVTEMGSAASRLLPPLVRADGGRVADARHVVDGAASVASAIASGEGDVVLVVGGTGYGRSDHAAAGLARAGRLEAHGIAVRPGETAGFGNAQGRPVILLPGSPPAMVAVYVVLVRALLRALAGAEDPDPRRAPLLRKVSSAIGFGEVAFARLTSSGLDPLGVGEIPLRLLLRADAALLVSPEREGYGEGTLVEFQAL